MQSRIAKKLLGEELTDFLSKIKVLLVGVGGIGCEVLKVLSKFSLGELHILDLDTIEVSNLNRQFLFRKQHRGHFKSVVAKEQFLLLNPNQKIFSYTDSIYDNKFDANFFQQFDLVIMALDNIQARQYINKIIVAFNIPTLDAGTTGYKGQCYILKRGETQCYDCRKIVDEQKVFPACTIRNMPEKPVHCIIYSKYLFSNLFGQQDDDSSLLADLLQDIDIKNATIENAILLFNMLFYQDIQNKKNVVSEESVKFKDVKTLRYEELNLKNKNYLGQQNLAFLQETHTVEIWSEIFRDSFIELMSRKIKDGMVVFEKDDSVCMKFITACSNLRSYLFGINFTNEIQVKKIAGNVIPAIASTNSIVAALEIVEGLKFFAKKLNPNKRIFKKSLFIMQDTVNKLLSSNSEKPNKDCLVCEKQMIPDLIYCDFSQNKLGDLVNFLSEKLQGFSIQRGSDIIYEQFEDMEEDEIENQEKQKQKQFESFFGGRQNQWVRVINENTNKFYRLYILIHQQNCNFNVVNQIPENERIEVDLNIFNKQDDIEEENKKNKKPIYKQSEGNNQFEILSESEDINEQSSSEIQIVEDNPQNQTNLKRKNPNNNYDEIEEIKKIQK